MSDKRPTNRQKGQKTMMNAYRMLKYEIYDNMGGDIDFFFAIGLLGAILGVGGSAATYYGTQGNILLLVVGIIMLAILLTTVTAWFKGRAISLMRTTRDLRAAANAMVREGRIDEKVFVNIRKKPVLYGLTTGKFWASVIFFIFGEKHAASVAINNMEKYAPSQYMCFSTYGYVPVNWGYEMKELFTRKGMSSRKILWAIRKFPAAKNLAAYEVSIKKPHAQATPSFSDKLTQRHDTLNEELLTLDQISISLTSPVLHELLDSVRLLEEKREDPFQMSQYATLLDKAEMNLKIIKKETENKALEKKPRPQRKPTPLRSRSPWLSR